MWEKEALRGWIMRYRPFIGLNIALGGSNGEFIPSATWSVADVRLLISLKKNKYQVFLKKCNFTVNYTCITLSNSVLSLSLHFAISVKNYNVIVVVCLSVLELKHHLILKENFMIIYFGVFVFILRNRYSCTICSWEKYTQCFKEASVTYFKTLWTLRFECVFG